MKRKILSAALFVAIAVAAGWNVNQSENEVTLSELGLANVEALANPEGAGDKCDNFSSMSCNSGGVVYDQMYPANRL